VQLRSNEELGSCEGPEAAECGCVAGFRRCDTCELRCILGEGCREELGVCRARDSDDFGGRGFADTCRFRTDGASHPGYAGGSGGEFCVTGNVCAVEVGATGTEDDQLAGICMPVEFCLARESADPPLPEGRRCVYADGSEVVDGPPPVACPPFEHPKTLFCGGSCGERVCPGRGGRVGGITDPAYPCVGLSETRGFGLCALSEERCLLAEPDHTHLLIDGCSLGEDEPCVCMVPQPQEGERQEGYPVFESACRAYVAGLPPGVADCRDADWNLLL